MTQTQIVLKCIHFPEIQSIILSLYRILRNTYTKPTRDICTAAPSTDLECKGDPQVSYSEIPCSI